MHGVFHVVFKYVFHVCDYVFVCYTLRGKHIHSMMYMSKYFSATARHAKAQEFLELKRGTIPVMKYVARFTELAIW